MESLDDIYAAAQSLPCSDRARRIALLWDGMAADDWVLPNKEWIREANRRSDSIDAGAMPTDAWETVRQRARRKAGLDD